MSKREVMLLVGMLTVLNLCGAVFAANEPVAGEKNTALSASVQELRRDNEAEKDSRLRWWREAKFGMFIHWGLYAVPAGEWKGKPFDGIGEWVMFKCRIPIAEYERLAAQFNPVKFDAEAWAQLAQDAGMKYMIITSKHHDGFSMFASKASKFNIFDATPFKRDPMKELADACAKRGIKFGFYYSQAQDWHEPGGAIWDGKHENGPVWEKKMWDPRQEGDFDKYFDTKVIPQVKELMSNYGPIGVVWFDTPLKVMSEERAGRLQKLVREIQPATLINGRLGGKNQSDYDSEGDNRIPGPIRKGDWETPATLNDTWGFKKQDQNWKKPEDLIFKLVDIVSKGGNYLLNVGPDAQGVIPQPSQDTLREVGKWLKVNGESIYGAGPTPFGGELGVFSTTEKDKKGNPVFDHSSEWRCTTKPGKLYIHLFKWPVGSFALADVQGKVVKAYMLSDPELKPLEVSQTGTKVSVKLPDAAPDKTASVLCIEL